MTGTRLECLASMDRHRSIDSECCVLIDANFHLGMDMSSHTKELMCSPHDNDNGKTKAATINQYIIKRMNDAYQWGSERMMIDDDDDVIVLIDASSQKWKKDVRWVNEYDGRRPVLPDDISITGTTF